MVCSPKHSHFFSTCIVIFAETSFINTYDMVAVSKFTDNVYSFYSNLKKK